MTRGDKRKTVLFLAPIDAHGHVNAMIGLANQVAALGYRTVFVCNDFTTPAHFGHQTYLARGSTATGALQQVDPQKAGASEENVFVRADGQPSGARWLQWVESCDLNICKLCLSEECADGAPLDDDELKGSQDVNGNATESAATSVAACLEHNLSNFRPRLESEVVAHDETYERIIVQLQPSLVVVEQLAPVACVHRIPGLRWISMTSCNPLPVYFVLSQLQGLHWFPPPYMGLPVRPLSNSQAEWAGLARMKQLYERALERSGMTRVVRELSQRAHPGASGLDADRLARLALNESPLLNLYMCPRELDYTREWPDLPANWVQVDSLVRDSQSRVGAQDADLLARLEAWRREPNALVVYLSLGSLVSWLAQVMDGMLRQVLRCLESRADWRFAVVSSKGLRLVGADVRSRLEHFEQAGRLIVRNWWPQPELMRRGLADVFVAHGGNNGLCEVFDNPRRPALVLVGVFHDQPDNARRVDQLGLGVALPAASLVEGPGSAADGRLLERAIGLALRRRPALNECALLEGRKDARFAARLIHEQLLRNDCC